MRTALADFDGTVIKGGRKITNLRYADDFVLICGSMTELVEPTNSVQMGSTKSGLYFNAGKTKVMKIIADKESYDNQNLVMDGEEEETVSEFCYLDAVFTHRDDRSIAKNAVVSLANIWKNKSVSVKTKMRLVKDLVFPIATYGAECWMTEIVKEFMLLNYGTIAGFFVLKG